MPLYSIKMRAAKGDLHVSGAERIIPQDDVSSAVSALTERALHHGLGRADFINVKMEEVAPKKLEYLDALPVSKRPADTVEETYKIMKEMLCELGLEAKADELVHLLRHNHPMRGAGVGQQGDVFRYIIKNVGKSTAVGTAQSERKDFRTGLLYGCFD